MNAQPKSQSNTDHPGTAAAAPRFDRKFIEEHHLLDRYLTNKLPLKGARDLEKWCRENPQYLEELDLPIRTQSSLKLLEAAGKPQDLAEPGLAWWKHAYFHIGLGVAAVLCALACLVLVTKYMLVRGELEDARAVAKHGALAPPSNIAALRVDPDHAPGINRARISVNHAAPAMIDLKVNMNFTKLKDFKVTLEKQDQGRVLVIEHLAKDSNGDLRISFNTSALSTGSYAIRIDGLPMFGGPIGMGWLILDAA